MTGYAIVESIFAKDVEGQCQTALEVFSLFIFVRKLGWGGEKLQHDLGTAMLLLGFMTGYVGKFFTLGVDI
jgi:hypothetical protein